MVKPFYHMTFILIPANALNTGTIISRYYQRYSIGEVEFYLSTIISKVPNQSCICGGTTKLVQLSCYIITGALVKCYCTCLPSF